MNKRLIAIAAVICAAVLVIAGVIAVTHYKRAVPQQEQSNADSVRNDSEADSETEPSETDAAGKKTGKASADKTKPDKDSTSADTADSETNEAADANSDVPDGAPDSPDEAQAAGDKKEPLLPDIAQIPPYEEEPEPKQETVVSYHAPPPPGKVSSKTTPAAEGIEDFEPEAPGSGSDDIAPEQEYDPNDHENELPEVEIDMEGETEED